MFIARTKTVMLNLAVGQLVFNPNNTFEFKPTEIIKPKYKLPKENRIRL